MSKNSKCKRVTNFVGLYDSKDKQNDLLHHGTQVDRYTNVKSLKDMKVSSKYDVMKYYNPIVVMQSKTSKSTRRAA